MNEQKNFSEIIAEVKKAIENRKTRSAWSKGVTLYALELVEELEDRAEYEGRKPESLKECKEWMLNGASDWEQYSYGGSSLIYNYDIAERLCCPSELCRCKGGERYPNSRETWLDIQTRALSQASNVVLSAIKATQATGYNSASA